MFWKKILHLLFYQTGDKKDDSYSALKILYYCHFWAVYYARFLKEKWIGYIILLSEKKATHCHRLCDYNSCWQAKIEECIQDQLLRLGLFAPI